MSDPSSEELTPLQRRGRVAAAFSPSTPVRRQDVFAGRVGQLQRLVEIVATDGQHALIYGERGVGKTSLAKVTESLYQTSELPFMTVFETCSTQTTFESMARSILRRIQLSQQVPKPGFVAASNEVSFNAEALLPADTPVTPNAFAEALEVIVPAVGRTLVVFVDELDRPNDPDLSVLMSDLLKIVADQAIEVTFVLIGVGETVDELMRGHNSVHRSLIEVQMPLMQHNELRQIVETGMAASGMTCDEAFRDAVARISLGLPHYTHILAQRGAYAALDLGRVNVTMDDFLPAIQGALEGASQSIREAYHRAISSNRETLYKEVLLACAQAQKDALGTFSTSDVRDRLSEILGRPIGIPAFAHHLNDFSGSSDARGGVLIKRGQARGFRYKFADPLMPPYVLMQGHAASETAPSAHPEGAAE